MNVDMAHTLLAVGLLLTVIVVVLGTTANAPAFEFYGMLAIALGLAGGGLVVSLSASGT